jgi:hypothetical protein
MTKVSADGAPGRSIVTGGENVSGGSGSRCWAIRVEDARWSVCLMPSGQAVMAAVTLRPDAEAGGRLWFNAGETAGRGAEAAQLDPERPGRWLVS